MKCVAFVYGLVGLGLVQSAGAAVIIETAGTNYSSGGPGLGIRGTRFALTEPTRITGASTPVLGVSATLTTTLDATGHLLPLLGNLSSFPTAGPNVASILSSSLAVSEVSISNPGRLGGFPINGELEFDFDTVLPAGNYAFVVTGQFVGGMPSSFPGFTTGNNTNLFVNTTGFSGPSWSSLADGYRFVVEGTPVPEPDALVLSVIGLAFAGRRRRACK